MLEYVEYVLFIFGLWTLIKGYLYLFYCFKSVRSTTDFSKYGLKSWALVTAPTDGIGLGFAEILSSYGFNLVLVGRNYDKLTNLSKYLEQSFPIKTKLIVKDFSFSAKDPEEFFQDIKLQTQGLDISIIVNNVGYGADGLLHTVPQADLLNVNSLNIWPVVYLTKLYLPDMLNRKNRSAIINLSSLLGTFPVPYGSCYSAGKSFISLFSLIAAEEARYLSGKENTNIDVLTVTPGWVDTPLTKKYKNIPCLISKEEHVEGVLRALGKTNYTSGHWKHQMQSIYANLFRDQASGSYAKKIRKKFDKKNI